MKRKYKKKELKTKLKDFLMQAFVLPYHFPPCLRPCPLCLIFPAQPLVFFNLLCEMVYACS